MGFTCLTEPRKRLQGKYHVLLASTVVHGQGVLCGLAITARETEQMYRFLWDSMCKTAKEQLGRELNTACVLADNDEAISSFCSNLSDSENEINRLNCFWHTLVKDLPKCKKLLSNKKSYAFIKRDIRNCV